VKEATVVPYADNLGVRIYYEVEGEGPPLVLQHGFSDRLEGLRELGYSEGLKNRYCLILIDARGHGASDKPQSPAAYALEPRAADVVAVLDKLGLQEVRYFGYSLGGWIGFSLAKYAPERVSSLIIGGAQPYGQSMELYRQGMRAGNEAWVSLVDKMIGPLSSQYKKRLLNNDVEALLASVANDRPDISSILLNMTMPCLLFAGDADPLYPLVRRCSAELPDATFFGLPRLTHLEAYSRSDLVLSHVVEFLESTRQQEADHLPRRGERPTAPWVLSELLGTSDEPETAARSSLEVVLTNEAQDNEASSK
jgi:pimeloyl-ACP methyl ester carboxylesterase